jgi:hypothetical protein
MPSLNIIGNINLTGGEYKRNPFIATGGQITTFTSGGIDYTSHTFTASGVFTLLNGETTAQVLVVGSGGKGQNGGFGNVNGNAGGAGGVAYTGSFFFRKNYAGGPSTFIASVGDSNEGTNPATTGSSSVFYSTYGYEQIAPVLAYGGGDGQNNGASGGGGDGLAIYGIQGNNGAVGGNIGGGGGAAQTGSIRDGGNGLPFTLQDGTVKYYAGGGGGGGFLNIGPTPGGTGGLGGGGNGGSGVQGAGQPGTPNTGGGGGGGGTANDSRDRGIGGPGGSGIIIISYPTGGA